MLSHVRPDVRHSRANKRQNLAKVVASKLVFDLSAINEENGRHVTGVELRA